MNDTAKGKTEMNMESMIKKVAQAMAYRSKARVAGLPLLNAVEMDGKENFMLLAEAAIEAMREPNEAMLQAGSKADDDFSEAAPQTASFWIYGSMIGAALKEQEGK